MKHLPPNSAEIFGKLFIIRSAVAQLQKYDNSLLMQRPLSERKMLAKTVIAACKLARESFVVLENDLKAVLREKL